MRRLKRSSRSAPPLSRNRHNVNMHQMAVARVPKSLMQTTAGCARNENIKITNLPSHGFPQSTHLLSCINNLIMAAQLCPLDDRRSAAEISLKLAVVHFTAMTAYGHLLSIRGEPTRVICRKMVLFFVYPGSIIVHHVMAALAIVSAYLLVRFKKRRNSASLRSSLKRAPAVLFGAIDRHPLQLRLHSSDEESMVKIMGRITVVLALVAQCIGSCIIFARRYQHDATTIGDWRVLELAIATLLISLLTVVHLLWRPALRLNQHDIFERSYSNQLSHLDATLLYLHEVPVLDESTSNKDRRTILQRECLGLLFNASTMIGAYWAQPWGARKQLNRSIRLTFSGGLVGTLGIFGYKTTICDECAYRVVFEIAISIVQIYCFTATVVSSAGILREFFAKAIMGKFKSVGWCGVLLRLLVLVLLAVLALGLVSVLLFSFCMIHFFPFWVVYMFGLRVFELVYQIIVLASWPTDLQCPLLWSDPKANVLWHLM